MSHLRRLAIVGVVLILIGILSAIVPAALNPAPPNEEKRRRDTRWVASSPYWLDRQACRFLGLCGVMHLRWDPPYIPPPSTDYDDDDGYIRRLELKRRTWESGYDEAELEELVREDSKTKLRAKGKMTKEEGRGRAALREIPSYVLEHAPLVHLFSGEHFWPADILDHVQHLRPFFEDEPINATATLSNLHKLNSRTGLVSLKSKDDVETRPDWLYSGVGKPVPFRKPLTEDDVLKKPQQASPDVRHGTGWQRHHRERTDLKDTTWFDVNNGVPLHHITDPHSNPGRQPPSNGRGRPFESPDIPRKPYQPPENQQPPHNTTDEGYSSAPAVLILVEKAPGILDAYWFFFYSYNLGQTVAGLRFGNHVGDWEHCMIRFQDGVPRAVFLSEHEGGQSYTFDAMERYNRWPERPVIFSAVGSHAMYGLPGKHPYVLPFGMLADETDRGPLWDPAKNTYAYFYDYEADNGDPFDDEESIDEEDVEGDQFVMGPDGRVRNKSLEPAASNPNAPTSWFHFTGAWGDNLYSLADIRQWRLFMQYHYVTGPKGPKDKHLDREKMCPRFKCRLLDHLDPRGKWY